MPKTEQPEQDDDAPIPVWFRLKPSVIEQIDEIRAAEKRSRSAQIAHMLEHYIAENYEDAGA